jgi:hypothetical protein
MEVNKLSNTPTLSPYNIEASQTNLFHNQHNSSELLHTEFNIRQLNINSQYYGYIFCLILFFGVIAYIIYEYTTNSKYPI